MEKIDPANIQYQYNNEFLEIAMSKEIINSYIEIVRPALNEITP